MNQASLNADNLQAITLDNLGFDLYSDDDYAQDIRNFTKAAEPPLDILFWTADTAELFQFYKELRSSVWNLTMSMLGNQETFSLTAKVHAAVQAFDTSQSQRRNLDALDLFAGRAAFKHTARDSGLTAESVEMTDDLINQLEQPKSSVLWKFPVVAMKTNKLGVSTVTGGKDLAASAAYTRCFCRAVLEVFEAARANHEWSIEAPMDYIFMWSQLNLRLAPLVPRVRNLEEDPPVLDELRQSMDAVQNALSLL
ncbi:hypothetical protein AK812_SmicGene46222 [Symbiodinium microadriaticum]|uniref:Uncharacterized protein n=1 Tax=Symbiodinium microadriaticum TaxID=2951 RepID=A0A1Q9BUG2_SYMMI|nr:hypothetical protein AK812_SmicGene46222 [Symbiodinium microadriaticum]